MDGRMYSFPVLPVPEIVECLSEVGIHLTEDNVLNPTPEVIQAVLPSTIPNLTTQKVYEELVQMFLNISPEEGQQMEFTAMDSFEYPNLHDQSISLVNFLRSMYPPPLTP
jgi:hypothetical protein